MGSLSALAACLTLLAGACSSGDHGSLEPIAGRGVTLWSTRGLPNDTARVAGGGVTAEVAGSWSPDTVTAEITYRLAAGSATIPVESRLVRIDGDVPATSAWDRTVPWPGNAIGRPLLPARRLDLRPRSRTVQIEYRRAANLPRFTRGERIGLLVPMPDGPAQITFTVAAE